MGGNGAVHVREGAERHGVGIGEGNDTALSFLPEGGGAELAMASGVWGAGVAGHAVPVGDVRRGD
jgi:hypothetical protein